MKICFFARGIPSEITGGMETHTLELAKGLIRRGHSATIVALIAPGHPRGSREELQDGLSIHYIGDKPYVTDAFHGDAADIFRRLNAEEDFDVVHSQEVGYGYGFARDCPSYIPFAVTIHGIPMKEVMDLIRTRSISSVASAASKYLRYRRIKYTYDTVLRRADRIIAVGKQLSMDIKSEYGLHNEKMAVIPNGIDVNKFRPLSARDLREAWGLTNEKVIVAPGRIDKYKGLDVLLKAFSGIHHRPNGLRLIIVGDGPYEIHLRKLAEDLGVKDDVIFTGRISHDEMPDYYNLADIVAFPTRRSESFGLVAAEAMACAKPVVASRIGELSYIIKDGVNGRLVTPGDIDDLRMKILMLLRRGEMGTEMGRAGRTIAVEKFSSGKMIDSTIEVYKRIIRDHHPSRG